MKESHPSHIFTIPPAQAFLPALVKGLYARFSVDGISRAQLFVPTRRAAMALRDAFLNEGNSGGDTAKLLPRISTIAATDEDAFFFNPDPEFAKALLELPPALSATQRQFLLMRLIRAAADIPLNHAQLFQLAADLGDLMDQAYIHNVPLDALETYVPENHEMQEHWQRARRFLHIIYKNWPSILAERGVMDATARRLALLRLVVQGWQRHPPTHLMIAAGSTASQPATAEWLQALSGLPQGYVVLPGLDTELEPESWQDLPATHPQYHMAQFLKRCGAEKEQIEKWDASQAHTGRNKLISEIMRPASSADKWRHLTVQDFGADVWRGLTRIDAKNDQQEAMVAALLIREKLQNPEHTIALVTPARATAKRVSAILKRWNVHVDDSAGQSLIATPVGSYLVLLLALLKPELRPSDVMAFFKHPFTGMGMARSAFLEDARALEAGFFRKTICGPTLEGWLNTLSAEEKFKPFAPLLLKLQTLLVPLLSNPPTTMAAFCEGLMAAAQNALAKDEDIFYGPNGEALAALLDDLRATPDSLEFSFEELCVIVEQQLARTAVRKAYGTHPRLTLLGLLEARLLDFDTVILAGLNEDVWPLLEKPDPWLSNAMRTHIGLPLHDDTIGLMAHDFSQQLAQKDVVLLRSLRSEGVPTQTSRWLLRMDAILEKTKQKDALCPSQPWVLWAEMLDRADNLEPCALPSVHVPPQHWPEQFRLTELELLVNDPYAFYARCILKLKKLEPLDAELDARMRGTLLHNALCAWFKAYPTSWPPDVKDQFISILQSFFAPYVFSQSAAQFLAVSFSPLADAFYDWEKERRNDIAQSVHEQDGVWPLRFHNHEHNREIKLKARADRIDVLKNGTLNILDYKTGTIPSAKRVAAGLSPQLVIEALMAQSGLFEGVSAKKEAELTYIKVGLNRGEIEEKNLPEKDIGSLAEHRAAFLAFMDVMIAGKTPFTPVPYGKFTAMANDYARLARVAEWSKGGLAQEEDGT